MFVAPESHGRSAVRRTALVLLLLVPAIAAGDPGNPGLDLSALPGPVLVVDDDRGTEHQEPFVQALSRPGRSPEVWEVARRGDPTPEALAAAGLVVWVTGGRWGDLSAGDIRLLEARIRAGGHTLLAGRYTGRDLSFGFRDRWLFGMEYRDTPLWPQVVVPAVEDPRPAFRVETDWALLAGAEPLYAIRGPAGLRRPGGGITVLRHWTRGARTAWIGFDLADVFSSHTRALVLRDVFWYLTFRFDAALAELGRRPASPEREAFLVEALAGEIQRGPLAPREREALARVRDDPTHPLRPRLRRLLPGILGPCNTSNTPVPLSPSSSP